MIKAVSHIVFLIVIILIVFEFYVSVLFMGGRDLWWMILLDGIASIDFLFLVESDGYGVSVVNHLFCPRISIIVAGGGVSDNLFGRNNTRGCFLVAESDLVSFFCQCEHAIQEIVPRLVADKRKLVSYAVNGVTHRVHGELRRQRRNSPCTR